jgi:hypothetical protein
MNKYFRSSGWIISFIVVSVFFLSNDNGVPQAVTFAPGEPSNSSCNACHSGGNFGASINMTLLNQDSLPITKYVGGQKYIVKVQVSGNQSKIYGFQMTALTTNGTKDVGKWSNFGLNVKQLTLINRKYLCQSDGKADGIFFAEWTAPAASEGEVKFYYSGLAGNKNGNNNGDQAAWGSSSYKPDGVSSTTDSELDKITVFPNPTTETLNIDGEIEEGMYQIMDIHGQIISMGSTSWKIDVSNLSSGVFVLGLTNASNRTYRKVMFVKQ